MAHATDLNLHSSLSNPGPETSLRPGEDAGLRETLKYCAVSTYPAACLFRQTGRAEYLPAIVLGVIERYVEPERRPRLREPNDHIRLAEDLGLDSLTLMEIVIRLEEVLQISIRDDELRQFQTLGEIRRLIESTVAAEPNQTLNAQLLTPNA
jgi:3-hydroxyacyl-[acyl-carrier-protein] dehydratase